MGLETVDFFHILGRDPTSNSYKTGVNVTTAHNQLIATRQELYQNLNKTRELGSLLDKSELQLQTFGERLPHLKKAMAPLLVQAESVKSVSEWIEESLGPAKNLIKKFDEAHLLEKTLIREPREDLEVYLSTVVKLADLLDYLKLNSGVAIKFLKEAMEVLLQEKSVDKYHVMKVNQSLMALIHHQSGQQSSCALHLLFAAYSYC
jgi:exocyst complex protein 7